MTNHTYEKALASMLRAKKKRQAQIAALRKSGKTFSEIGKILGVSPQRVHQLAKVDTTSRSV